MSKLLWVCQKIYSGRWKKYEKIYDEKPDICSWIYECAKEMIIKNKNQHKCFYTHLLRTILSNLDVGCILRAKTFQLNLTGVGQ